MSLEFEWDERKRKANMREHGVDFLRAAKVFQGPTLEDVDDREDYGEERIIALGHADGAVFTVVYTMRGSVVRLISAWKANSRDEERYYAEVLDR